MAATASSTTAPTDIVSGCSVSCPASPNASVRRSSTSRSKRAGVVEQHRQVGVVARVDAVELGLDLALQHGERCAELVGDVGEETPARLLRRLEPARHLVEGSPERAHGPRAGGSHTGVIVPATETLGAVEQVADRAGQATVGEERGNERGADDCDDNRRPTSSVAVAARLPREDPEQHAEPDPDHRDDDGDAQESAPPPVRARRAMAAMSRRCPRGPRRVPPSTVRVTIGHESASR